MRVSYSKEEIVAEFGAALLCRQFGITSEDDNTAAYLQGWSEAIKENPDWLINGANAAQKAVDYMNEIVAGGLFKNRPAYAGQMDHQSFK